MTRPSLSCFFRIAFSAALFPVTALAEEPVDFSRDIRPILSDTCFTCHGPDDQQRQVNLRLDTREGLFADRGGYQIVAPGDPGKSRLFERISADNPAMRMPPPYAERHLNADQVELIRRWIEQGAKWERHWALVAAEPPQLPVIRDKSWPRNPIDHFVLARLEQEGLSPSPEAEKTALIRRVTLSLTGLPPTLQEVEKFLSDPAPDAYERLVDRLLASPHYGERMAMTWLDLARYADTHGYHIDSHRDMWLWRDWVIQAYNRNLPFDQFTIEQLAGDLLPEATIEQKIATGFNRNHMINFEGGAIPEEYLNEYIVDRVNTTATTWMGLTMGCARCHDHKYDPITQREFYQFYAFFNGIDEKGLDGRTGNAQPFLMVPSHEQQETLSLLEKKIASLEAAMPVEETLDELTGKWEKKAIALLPETPQAGLVAHYELDGHTADTSGYYRHAKIARGDLSYEEGRIGKAAKLDGDSYLRLGEVPGFGRSHPFALALWIKPTRRNNMTLLAKLDPQSRTGFSLSFPDAEDRPLGERGFQLIVRLGSPEKAVELKTEKYLLLQSWYHLAISYGGSGQASGFRIYIDGHPQEVRVLKDDPVGFVSNSEPLYLGRGFGSNAFGGQVDELRLYDRELDRSEAEQLAHFQPIRAILAEPASERAGSRQEQLRDYYLSEHASPEHRQTYIELKERRREKSDLEKTVPTTMIMQRADTPRETFLLERGAYDEPGERVEPGVPSCLPALEDGAPLNRLSLAKWLVEPSHPLTARVAINRYWSMYFGAGLVRTAENFGSQGEPPTHPQLLDWLATEFIRSGWDVKGMQRLIVTSATYRQSSRPTPELLQKDPENRLLARASRFRLPAETIRDSALALSGRINLEIGGPSVSPYQPPGLWEVLAFGGGFTAQKYEQSHGPDLYRRSMYTFWKRTSPPPTMSLFDAPDRETCVARRARTNTPLQALVLMNETGLVEAARGIAERIVKEGGDGTPARAIFGFRLATARRPSPDELDILIEKFERHRSFYQAHADEALALLAVGESSYDEKLEVAELAAWTTVANMILNLDEVMTRE